jgi:hypothetical protein
MATSDQLSWTDWLKNVREGYGPSGQGARSEAEVPVVWRDPNSGLGIGVAVKGNQVENLVYFDPQGRPLRSSIFTAPELYRNASEFGIGLDHIGGLGVKLDNAGIKYKPGELYAGVGSNLGINFSDVQQGKLGSAYDWTQDPFAAQKGPSASDQLASSQALADRLGIKRETSENLAQINPYVGPSGTRNFAVVVPSISGSPTVSYYATQEEADAAKYLYNGTVYNLAETGGISLGSQPAQQQQTQTTQQQSPRTKQILDLLPKDWDEYTPANKRFWFESKGVTSDDLKKAGIPQTDINALYAQPAVEKKGNQAATGLLDTNNQTTNVTNQSTTGLLDTNNQTTNVTNQSTTGLLDTNILLDDASAVFESVFGRKPNQQELDNFASIAANDPRLASTTAFGDYLKGTPDYTDYLKSITNTGNTGNTDYQGTVEGGAGVDFKGSSGLREAYGPYVMDYLSRMSGLLARRDIDPTTKQPAFTGLQFGGTGVGKYGTETAQTLKDLQTQRENMMGMGTGINATPDYQPFNYSFASDSTIKKAASGGIMSLVDGYADGGMAGGQTLPSTFTAPTGTYQQSTYDPTKAAGYVAPGTYQPGTIGSEFDATKAGAYTGPEAGKEITSKFATPTGLYTPGTIGNTFDATKAGAYTGPTGKGITSTFTAPTGLYTPGTIGNTFDATKAGAYTGPTGKGITSTFTAPTGLYTPGTIGSEFDATKAGMYTGPTGTGITSTFTAPTGLYTPGTISSEFDATKAGMYTAPTGKDTITSTYTDPANLYKAGNIGSTYDPNTGLYSGPGTGITTETFDTAALQRLMSPYMSGVVDPQVREARRQAEITRQAQAARMAKAGSFGGSRQAISEAELNRNLATQLEDIYGKGQQGAFDAALRAFEAEQGRKLQAATATETARQEAGRQALTGEEAETRFGLQAATAQEAARQAAGQQALSAAQTAGQLGLQAATAQEAAKQAAGQQALSAAQTAGQLGLQAATAQEQAKQAAGQQALTAATTGAELSQRGQIAQEAARQAAGQQALTAATTGAELSQRGQIAQEAARQAAGQQALSAAQTAGQLGLQAATAQEAARQAAGQQALSAAQTAGQLGLQAATAQEAARQAAGQQALSAAEIAGRLGLQGSELSERSRQFAAQYGLDVAKTSAQYDQQARQLQQQAEEAQARGDQFAATLALQQLQEAQRAAETTRAFEYQQARDTYLDPYREIMYANQALGGLPISAAATGISPNLEALVAALGLNQLMPK